MGILTNKDNEPNSGKTLEDVMDKFNIELDNYEINTENTDEITEKRRIKKEKEKESF